MLYTTAICPNHGEDLLVRWRKNENFDENVFSVCFLVIKTIISIKFIFFCVTGSRRLDKAHSIRVRSNLHIWVRFQSFLS